MKSFHFDMGNSTTGPIGLCARIEAETEQQATDILRSLLTRRSGQCNEFELWKEGNQYITAYVNPHYPHPGLIDDQENV